MLVNGSQNVLVIAAQEFGVRIYYTKANGIIW